MAKYKSNLNNKSDKENNYNSKVSRNKFLKEKTMKEIISKISKLSYEESLLELDIILNNLQDENTLLEELQENYLKANLYLEHCQKLLSRIEQEVIEITSEELESLSNE